MTFDDDQQAVIDNPDGARSVIAGPGAGKSSTMVGLIRRLIERGVPPSQIRAVTFSKEMASTLEKRIKIPGIASTFHSLGYLICSEVNRKPVEPELRFRLMMQLIKKYHLDYKELDGFIARMRCTNVSPDAALQPESGFDWGLARAYADYEVTRAREGWMDFDSMLADSVAMLENPDVRRRWSPKFLIVDEAQDTSDVQWRMLQLMSKQHGNIVVVGDPAQAIYAFRGANPENLLRFEKWFQNPKRHYLGRNYRCHPAGTLISVCTRNSYGRGGPSVISQIPIEQIKDGQKVITWRKRDDSYRIRGRVATLTKQSYVGDMIEVCTSKHTVQVTPNHRMIVRLNLRGTRYLLYLMWRKDLGFRIGQCSLSHTYGDQSRLTIRLWHRIHNQKPDKIWILNSFDTEKDVRIQENIMSSRFGIPQIEYVQVNKNPYYSQQEITHMFSRIPDIGGYKLLRETHKFFDFPFWEKSGDAVHIAKGYFVTRAANLLPHIMEIPCPENWDKNGSRNHSYAPITDVTHHPYTGDVYSLSVERDHNYIANGLVVGNSTPQIVRFVRENAPPDTPKELLDRMIPARTDAGERIGMKMYWTPDEEAESALALARKDPMNSVILARTNSTVGLLERLCNQHKVRYHLLGKTGFWKQAEIRKAVEELKNFPNLSTEAAMNLILPKLEAKYAVDNRTERDNDALQNLQSLRGMGRTRGFNMAREFYAYANRMIHRRNDPNGVTISTVHQAKGLEFSKVFIIGANAKGFPHPKGDPAEERRIWFVAVSRPIDYLRISFAGTPSPYLRRYLTDEILDKLREHATEVEKLQTQAKLFV